MQIQSEIYIHAATGAVWQKFSQVNQWPRWNSQVQEVRWLDNQTIKPWQEGARFAIRHQSILGATTTKAVVRMCVPANTVVWESSTMGLQIVNSASFSDDAGGCKLRAKHTYHGPMSLVVQLLRGRQQQLLETAMQELKEFVEGSPRH